MQKHLHIVPLTEKNQIENIFTFFHNNHCHQRHNHHGADLTSSVPRPLTPCHLAELTALSSYITFMTVTMIIIIIITFIITVVIIIIEEMDKRLITNQ